MIGSKFSDRIKHQAGGGERRGISRDFLPGEWYFYCYARGERVESWYKETPHRGCAAPFVLVYPVYKRATYTLDLHVFPRSPSFFP